MTVRHIVGRLYVPYSCQPPECTAVPFAVHPSVRGDADEGVPAHVPLTAAPCG